MSNVNSLGSPVGGWINLPVQSITTTSATVVTSPQTSVLYPGLPSPAFPAGSALFLNFGNTVQSSNPTSASPTYVNDLVDGHQFRIRVVGIATVGASTTLTVSIQNGSSSTATSNTTIAASTAYTITTASSVNFLFETNCLWDSTTAKLNGWFNSDVNNTFTGAAAITSITSLSATSLQFPLAFTFGTANAANTVTVKEFIAEIV